MSLVRNQVPDYTQSSGRERRIPGTAGILSRVDGDGTAAVRGLQAHAPDKVLDAGKPCDRAGDCA